MAAKENIVISGIAGRLPECDNVEDFWKALYNGIDLMTYETSGKTNFSIRKKYQKSNIIVNENF